MCTSRIHRVVAMGSDPGLVEAEDTDGRRHAVSLLALDGGLPQVGDWLVVHSGYAIDRVEPADAEAVLEELQRADQALGRP